MDGGANQSILASAPSFRHQGLAYREPVGLLSGWTGPHKTKVTQRDAGCTD